MDYTGAREAFFAPRADGAARAGSEDWQLPGRELRHVLEPIATINFWSEPAYDAYAALGLDFLTGYVWARACPLGEPVGAVVAAAFGAFDPAAVDGLYQAARGACGREEILTAREDGARTALAACLPEDDITRIVAVLRRGAEAIDPTGRALTAGLLALPWPADDHARLWHAATILREYRGDAHLAAYLTAGLSGLEANLLTERRIGWDPLGYTASRAWSPESMAAATAGLASRGLLEGDGLSAEGRALRDRIETATEAQLAPVLEAIGDDLALVLDRCGRWSQRIIEHGWFPPDAYKRAAG